MDITIAKTNQESKVNLNKFELFLLKMDEDIAELIYSPNYVDRILQKNILYHKTL
jgi:hypothetical protein